jgi:hypothetical protein
MTMMIKTMLVAATVAIGLAACAQLKPMTGQTAAGVAGGVATAAVTPENLAKIGALCNAGGAALDAAARIKSAPVLQETAVYGAAFCRPVLDGLPPPATTDANSPSWLSGIISALPSLAKAAGVLLPAIMGR